MSYKKLLPDKRIFVEGIPHYHCSVCCEYHPYEDMMKNKNGSYGVTRNCKVCYVKTYVVYVPIPDSERKIRKRRSSEEKFYDDKINREMKHINYRGVSQEDLDEVQNVMKRLGYHDKEPVWVQFNRKYGF